MTLLAYDWNSVLVGMCAVLLVVLVMFTVLLDRANRSRVAMEFLMAENTALRSECAKRGVDMVVAHPLSEVRPVSVPSMWRVGGAMDVGAKLYVAATDELWLSAPGGKVSRVDGGEPVTSKEAAE